MDDSEYEEFVTLLTRHQRQIWTFLNALLPAASDADDVMQETSLVLWRKWQEFEKGSDFPRWARSVARLEALRFARQGRSKSVQLSESVLETVADAVEEIQDELSHADDRRAALLSCIDKLAPTERQAIEARYLQGRPTREIAEASGRPLQTVYSLLARARAQLIRCVQRSMAAAEANA